LLLTAYRDFEKRTGILTATRGAKTATVLDAIGRLPDGFKMVDLERVCPNVTRDMIRVVLNSLKKDQKNLLRRVWWGGNLEKGLNPR